MTIHRQKKLNAIAKLKDEICKHLNSSNEVNAKIWCETLINDEGQIPCYDVTHTMCDQVRGRLEYLSKYGAPPDMTQTFATIIHVAPKFDVEELMSVRKQLVGLLGKEFEIQCDEDKSIINPMIAENIDFRKPMEGEIIYRLRQLAKERNIQYEPSCDARQALNHYLDFKGISDPMDDGAGTAKIQQPVYNPPAPLDPNMNNQDNNNNNQQPPGFPPG